MAYFVMRQLPIPPPTTLADKSEHTDGRSTVEWVSDRCRELNGIGTRNAERGNIWDEERRFQLRCELDAAFFHLYGISRDDVDYIMDTFPIVKRKDEKKYGEYRAKRVILEVYDEMAKAMEGDVSRGERPEVSTKDRSEESSLTPWQAFCQEKRLEGHSFEEISAMWKARNE